MSKIKLMVVALWITTVISGHGKAVSGTITVSVDLSAQTLGEEARLWLPYPTTDTFQDISNILVEGTYSESSIQTNETFGTPMLFARWAADTTNRILTLSFSATRREQTRPKFSPTESALIPDEHALYLRATRMAPLSDHLVQLAAEITAEQNSILEKARAIYDWTVDNTTRNPATRGCGMGEMSTLLEQPCGKCADISSVFIALCRAAGVPAREVLGLRMGKVPVQDITTWQHCWSEFFLPGTGWVSVDPADVRKKMLVENLSLDAPETAAYREYFFGGLDAYRIKLGQGRDIQLKPRATGGPINYLMYPFAQVGGKTLDWLDPKTFTYTITFEGNDKRCLAIAPTAMITSCNHLMERL